MLVSLSIRNVVLIDKLDLNFDSGLNVFTGETGAGKSVLLDSLSLVLGARADAGLVRHGEKQLSVTATFQLNAEKGIFQLLEEQGISFDISEELVLRRTVTQEGKSKAFINDEPVSISFLKTVGDRLVEIHGQFASHQLLNASTHLSVLDLYANLQQEKQHTEQAFNAYKQALDTLKTAKQELETAQKQELFLREAIEDIEKLQPQQDEEEILVMRRNQLMNGEKIITAVNTSVQLLDNEQQGIIHQLAVLEQQLIKAAQYAPNVFDNLLETINETQSALADISGELESVGETLGDVSELPEIDNRLFALRGLARRYQTDINELPILLDSFRQQLNQLEQSETVLHSLQETANITYQQYLSQARKLSQKRKEAAEKLDKAVCRELGPLKLEKAQFLTQILTDETNISANGIDSVCFQASTNKGVPVAPLNKMASGGELSRFMLALKVNLATTAETETIIFDEVDSGVGGATAEAVGERLAQLGLNCQVLVVTHSPQVASCGKSHWHVQKAEQNDKMITTIRSLSEPERLAEIARMLSGAKITQTAEIMAQELLNKSWKKAY
ncbi:MAG: DNA repair protein RecN [Alphaproteobacteria bacterium]|nr:DNA repair protein RecN [Alphaproteobacteria bacterium]